MAATKISIIWINIRGEWDILVIIQCPWLTVMAIPTSSSASPIRFVKAVIIPALRDFWFW